MRRTVVGLGLVMMMSVAALVLWTSSVPAGAAAQPAACPPLQMSDIEDYVDVKAPVAVVRRRVAECGLGFTFDKTAEDRLRTLGAQADLIALLTNLGRAGLEVRSTPAGAAVTIDGQRRGTTPLTLSDLAPGAHKVLLSFEGYLDNASEVTVKAGDTERIERNLTRAPAQGTPAVAPPKGGSKLPWIIGGVAVAGAGAAVALSGGTKDTTTTSVGTTTTTTTPDTTVNISTSSLSFGSGGGSQQADVTCPGTCSWTFSGLPSWLTVSPLSGTNNQTVTFTASANVADNASTSQRTASLSVGGRTVAITQAGLQCSFTLELYVNDNPFVGGGATTAGSNDRQLILTTGPECRWTGVSSAPWLDFRSGRAPISGTGSRARGQLDIRFDANPGGQRQGSITVGGRTVNFTQCALGFRGNAEKTACVPG